MPPIAYKLNAALDAIQLNDELKDVIFKNSKIQSMKEYNIHVLNALSLGVLKRGLYQFDKLYMLTTQKTNNSSGINKYIIEHYVSRLEQCSSGSITAKFETYADVTQATEEEIKNNWVLESIHKVKPWKRYVAKEALVVTLRLMVEPINKTMTQFYFDQLVPHNVMFIKFYLPIVECHATKIKSGPPPLRIRDFCMNVPSRQFISRMGLTTFAKAIAKESKQREVEEEKDPNRILDNVLKKKLEDDARIGLAEGEFENFEDFEEEGGEGIGEGEDEFDADSNADTDRGNDRGFVKQADDMNVDRVRVPNLFNRVKRDDDEEEKKQPVNQNIRVNPFLGAVQRYNSDQKLELKPKKGRRPKAKPKAKKDKRDSEPKGNDDSQEIKMRQEAYEEHVNPGQSFKPSTPATEMDVDAFEGRELGKKYKYPQEPYLNDGDDSRSSKKAKLYDDSHLQNEDDQKLGNNNQELRIVELEQLYLNSIPRNPYTE